jgi:hypothetical protein
MTPRNRETTIICNYPLDPESPEKQSLNQSATFSLTLERRFKKYGNKRQVAQRDGCRGARAQLDTAPDTLNCTDEIHPFQIN